ncbi:MAG: hypothetical protein ACUVV6_03045 [Thermoplasmatota archaeon]
MSGRLEADLRVYREIRDMAGVYLQRGEVERCLDCCRVAAALASHVHIGLWFDDELEGLVRRAGELVGGAAGVGGPTPDAGGVAGSVAAEAPRRKRVAYIASFLSDMGGHSRNIRQMILLTRELAERHVIFVTNVSNAPSSHSHFERGLRGWPVEIVELPRSETYARRVATLRERLREEAFDLAFLFVSGDDVIALSALTGLKARPPTLLFNHNDIDFWLGRGVVDCLIDGRTEGAAYSRAYRRIPRSFILPVTTDIERLPRSRSAIGIPEDATLSVSLGSYYKTIGDPELDYFRVIGKILDRFPRHHHILLTGPPPPDIKRRVAALPLSAGARRRLLVYGPEPNPLPVYSSADLVIETFPAIGGMVRVEAMAVGLPIVGFRNRKFSLLSETDNFPPDYPFIASSEREVEEHTARLLENAELRENTGRRLQEHFRRNFAPAVLTPGFREFLTRCLSGGGLDGATTGTGATCCPATARDIERCPEYDVGYAHSWRYRDFHPYRGLALQTVMKEGDFSLLDRARFYLRALREGELPGALERAAYLSLLLAGRPGYLALSRLSRALS